MLAITSGSWKVFTFSSGTIGFSSVETGVDGSDDLFSDGLSAVSFPKNEFILKYFYKYLTIHNINL